MARVWKRRVRSERLRRSSGVYPRAFKPSSRLSTVPMPLGVDSGDAFSESIWIFSLALDMVRDVGGQVRGRVRLVELKYPGEG